MFGKLVRVFVLENTQRLHIEYKNTTSKLLRVMQNSFEFITGQI